MPWTRAGQAHEAHSLARRSTTERRGRGGAWREDGLRLLRRSAQDARDELGILSVSVFLVLDEDLKALCAREPYLSRYGKVRLSTVGRLRAAGFVLVPTLSRPHYDIVLPDVDEVTLDRLDVCFDVAVSNPARGS